MKRFVCLAIAALVTLPSFAQDSFSEPVDRLIDYHRGLVALENVTVFDGTGAEAISDQTIIINGGTIQTVGASSEVNVPEGATGWT
jgi:hypothetical protein